MEEANDFYYNKKKEKRHDIENPNFKVSYKDFCERIYEEIDNNSKLVIESSFEVLRKVFTLLKLKRLSVFEANKLILKFCKGLMEYFFIRYLNLFLKSFLLNLSNWEIFKMLSIWLISKILRSKLSLLIP